MHFGFGEPTEGLISLLQIMLSFSSSAVFSVMNSLWGCFLFFWVAQGPSCVCAGCLETVIHQNLSTDPLKHAFLSLALYKMVYHRTAEPQAK